MRRHAQIHLPPLSGEDASRLLVWLERASSAIWRAHGPEILNFRLRIGDDLLTHPFDDDEIPCFCPRHPERDNDDDGPPL
jgi:hypothetical protein